MPIATLYERDKPTASLLSRELEQLYDGGLSFPRPHEDRPYVVANFVETPMAIQFQ
jgi:hypothetical protein